MSSNRLPIAASLTLALLAAPVYASEDGRKVHISFDIDALDPAFTTGTGTPVPGGLTMREAIAIVRRLCA